MDEFILSLILEVIKPFFPDIGIDSLIRIEKIQLADKIDMHLHLDRGDTTKSAAIITTGSRDDDSIAKEGSFVFQPGVRQLDSQPRQIPFGSGTHLIINQLSWWDVPRKNYSISNRLQICPLVAGERDPLFIKTPGREQELRVELKGQDLTVKMTWANRQVTVDCSVLSGTHSESAANSVWTFKKYLPNQIIRFQDDSLTHFIFSFDEDIVKEAILIERERIRGRDAYENEYYILVSKIDDKQ